MRRLILLLVSILLVITACGGSSGEENTGDPGAATTEVSEPDDEDSADTDTTVPQTDTTQTTATGGDESATPEVGEAGSFTVNETEFVVTLLNRCIPFSDSPGNLDLQALAQGEGAKLNLVLMGGTTEVSVDGSGIQEAFGSMAFAGDSFDEDGGVQSSEIAGDRWTGSATLYDSLDSGETVDVIWDVMVPAEAQDCGL